MAPSFRLRATAFALAALLFSHAVTFSTAAEADKAEKEKSIDSVSEDETAVDTASEAPSESDTSDTLEESTENGILAKLKEFPDLGEHGAGLLQLAEESLGISASKLELGKIVPMLLELQKNVHEHYVLTKGKGKYKPSILKRVVGRKSQNRVIKTMKKFAPNTDEAELMQQLDIVTQLLHELHTNPQTNIQDVLRRVSSAVGVELEEEDMEQLSTHMEWAQDLVQKLLPYLPASLGGKKSEEL